MILTTLILTLWIGSTAFAQSDPLCQTDKKKNWLCEGDKAWRTGYLIDGDTLKKLYTQNNLLERVLEEREAYRSLSDRLQQNRIDFEYRYTQLMELYEKSKEIQGEATSQRDRVLKDLSELEGKYSEEYLKRIEAEVKLQSRYESWEVGLISSGAAIGGLLVGILIGMVAN